MDFLVENMNDSKEKEIERLKMALRWYAGLVVNESDLYGGSVSVDYGRVARAALGISESEAESLKVQKETDYFLRKTSNEV